MIEPLISKVDQLKSGRLEFLYFVVSAVLFLDALSNSFYEKPLYEKFEQFGAFEYFIFFIFYFAFSNSPTALTSAKLKSPISPAFRIFTQILSVAAISAANF